MRCCLWSRSGSLVASGPEGNQAALVVSSRITRCWGAASSGWTPPERPDWLRPPTRRGIRDLPSVGIGHRSRTTPATMAAAGIDLVAPSDPRADPAAAGVSASMRGRCLTPPHGGRFRIPRRVGADRSPRRADGVKSMPHPTAADQRYPSGHGLDTGGPAWYSHPQRRDEGSGPGPQAAPQPTNVRPTPRSEAARRAGAAGGIAPRLWARRPVALDLKPHPHPSPDRNQGRRK